MPQQKIPWMCQCCHTKKEHDQMPFSSDKGECKFCKCHSFKPMIIRWHLTNPSCCSYEGTCRLTQEEPVNATKN